MAEKKMNARILHKHDAEANWNKATGFIPKEGELIIYDVDNNHSKPRFKAGDGKTVVMNLPFTTIDGIENKDGVMTIGSVWTKPIDEYDIPEELPREIRIESTDFKITTGRSGERTIIDYNDTDDETVDMTAELTIGKLPEFGRVYTHIQGSTIDIQVPTDQFTNNSVLATPVNIYGEYDEDKGDIGVVEVNGELLYNGDEVATKSDLKNIDAGVTSVNGKTGAVTLNASDVGAFAIHNEGSIAITSKDAYNGVDNPILSFTDNSELETSYDITLGGVSTLDSFGSAGVSIEGTAISICPASLIDGAYHETVPAITTYATTEWPDTEIKEIIKPITDIYGELYYNDKEVATKEDLEGIGLYEYITEDTSNNQLNIIAEKFNIGENTTVFGKKATIEGLSTNKATSYVTTSTANTDITTAWTNNKFSLAKGNASHVEGQNNLALDHYTHVEGSENQALGGFAHAEGWKTIANGTSAHAEGNMTYAGNRAHAEGESSRAEGQYSHAEGRNTLTQGLGSHAEGRYTKATKDDAHAEGHNTKATNYRAHAEGFYTIAAGQSSHAEGAYTEVYGTNSHVQGLSSASAASIVSGLTDATATSTIKTAWENSKFALVIGDNAHGEGRDNLVLGDYSHAEGRNTIAGDNDTSAWYAHAEGKDTQAIGNASHAEGLKSIASGAVAHAEGSQTEATGDWSHAEGALTKAQGDYSHASGTGTIAKETAQFVCGAYNADDSNALLIVGAAQSDLSRSNCFSTGRSSDGKSYAKIGNAQLKADGSKVLYNNSEVATKSDLENIDIPEAVDLHGVEFNEGSMSTPAFEQYNEETSLDEFIPYEINAQGALKLTGKDYYDREDRNIISFESSDAYMTNYGVIVGDIHGAGDEMSSTTIQGGFVEISAGASGSDGLVRPVRAISVTGEHDWDGDHWNEVRAVTEISGKLLYNDKEVATKEDITNAGGGSVDLHGVEFKEGVMTLPAEADGYDILTSGNLNIIHSDGSDVLESHTRNILSYSTDTGIVKLGGEDSQGQDSQGANPIIEGSNIKLQVYPRANEYNTGVAEAIVIEGNEDIDNIRTVAKTYINGELYYNNKEVATKEDITNATGGIVTSVNGKVGAVTLGASDVGAYTTAQVDSLIAEIDTESNLPIEYDGRTVNINAPELNVLSSLAVGTVSDAEYANSSAMGYKVSVLASEAHAQGKSSNKAYGREGILPSGLSNWEIITEWGIRKFLVAAGVASHAEGTDTLALGDSSHAQGKWTIADGDYTHAEGVSTQALGDYSHAEGRGTIAGSNELDEEGNAIAWFAHAEGVDTQALGRASHSEGDNTIAGGRTSHAEGENNTTYGKYSHIEGGANTITETGDYAHVEGGGNSASGKAAHVEGGNNIASGDAAHAEGNYTEAIGDASHTSGYYTIAKEDAQFVCGAGNTDEKSAMFIVGGSDDPNNRNNCFTAGRELVNGERSKDGEAYIKVGSTMLTETQLVKILKFIESIEEVNE